MSEDEKMAVAIVEGLLKSANANQPENFKAFFCGGIITNIVGQLSDEYWRKFMKVEICDEPGCDCYKLQEQTLAALDAMRDDYKKHFQAKPPVSPIPQTQ